MLISLLLEYDADINALNDNNDTPLHMMTKLFTRGQKNFIEIRMLLENRQNTRGVRRAGNGSAWAARAGKPTCRSTHINLLFGFFENLSQNLFLYM